MNKSDTSKTTAPDRVEQEASNRKIIPSKQLFAGKNEIEIEHNGKAYRLRQTSLGKLILTK